MHVFHTSHATGTKNRFQPELAGAVRQQNMGLEMQNSAAEIKLRAERKAGGMLCKMEKHPGGKPSNKSGYTMLPDLGITKIESHRWQSVAHLPGKAFEAYIQENKEGSNEITTAEVFFGFVLGHRLKPKREAWII